MGRYLPSVSLSDRPHPPEVSVYFAGAGARPGLSPVSLELSAATVTARAWLTPAEARAVASRLIEAADAQDAASRPACDHCGEAGPTVRDAHADAPCAVPALPLCEPCLEAAIERQADR